MSQITDYMSYTQQQQEAQTAAFLFRDDEEQVKVFLTTKRQQLDPIAQRKLRNARFDGKQMLIGKDGYRLEWRMRADPDKPINDETNPQYPHGVAVLTKPLPPKDLCTRCQKRPGIKTDGEGTLICHKCASYAGDPSRRSRPKTHRNAPCHCGSGRKYKQCHMPRPGIEANKLVGAQGESTIVVPGHRSQRSQVNNLAAIAGALLAERKGIVVLSR